MAVDFLLGGRNGKEGPAHQGHGELCVRALQHGLPRAVQSRFPGIGVIDDENRRRTTHGLSDEPAVVQKENTIRLRARRRARLRNRRLGIAANEAQQLREFSDGVTDFERHIRLPFLRIERGVFKHCMVHKPDRSLTVAGSP